MRKLVVSGVVALLVAMTPLVVMAQASTFDEETRAVVVALVQRVASTLTPGYTDPSDDSEDGEVPEDVEPMPQPQPEEPEAEPTDEPVTLPELDLTDLAEYTNQGVTFQAPADWVVDLEMGDSTPFFIEVPGTNLLISMESDSGLDFPSWLALALLRSQPELLLADAGENAQLEESATLYNPQNLPIAKLEFSGAEDDVLTTGAFFAVAPNENAYIMIGGGSAAEWEYAKPGIELLVESITFDEELITAVLAEDGPLVFSDEEGTVEATVPAGWYAMATGDVQFPIIFAEPEVRYVAAIGTGEVFGGEFDPAILEEFIPAEGVLDPEVEQDLFETIIDMVSNSDSPIEVDEELSALQSREGAVTVRLVGEAELDSELSMPVVFYIDLRTTGVGVVAIFGDTESAFAVEEEIQTLLESVTGL